VLDETRAEQRGFVRRAREWLAQQPRLAPQVGRLASRRHVDRRNARSLAARRRRSGVVRGARSPGRQGSADPEPLDEHCGYAPLSPATKAIYAANSRSGGSPSQSTLALNRRALRFASSERLAHTLPSNSPLPFPKGCARGGARR
jgi:hypothetical protein